MIAPIDVASLSETARKIVGPGAPPRLQQMAARGIAPGLRPGEVIAVLVLLSKSPNVELRETAEKTILALPEVILNGALAGSLPPAAIDTLALAFRERIDVLERLVSLPDVPIETIEELARAGSEAVCELIATNEQRMLSEPHIIELLYLNRRTRMSTADRLIDLAVRHGITLSGIGGFKEAALALKNELIPEPTAEPTPDDVFYQEAQQLADQLQTDIDEDAFDETEDGGEQLKDRFVPLYKRIADMTISQKIRRALLGTKEERMLLVRDQNRLVSSAAVRSPMMQEPDIVLISRNRNLADDVLRIVATSPEWLKSYTVKKNLLENPKTPQMLALRLITHMRESDLRLIAKSRNISSAIANAAKQHLDRRKH